MFRRSRGTLAGVAAAALIASAGVFGGYQLTASHNLALGKVNLAQASRTWISGTGDDANPCSRTAPCKTFAGAISKTAAGGEIDCLDPGGFGAVTITKAITLDGGGGGKCSILTSGTNGIVVQAGASDVVIIRHLSLQGIGTCCNGIRFLAGKALILDDDVIENYSSNGVDVALGADGSSVTIHNTRIHNVGGAGVNLATTVGTVRTTISDSEIVKNYHGVVGSDGSDTDVANTVIGENTSVGVGCQTGGTRQCTMEATHDQLDHNWSAVYAARTGGSSTIVIGLNDNDLMSNSNGINNVGSVGTVVSAGNNRFVNNGTDIIGPNPGPMTLH